MKTRTTNSESRKIKIDLQGYNQRYTSWEPNKIANGAVNKR